MNDTDVYKATCQFAAKSRGLAISLSLCALSAFPAVSALADTESAWVLDRPLVPFSATYAVGNDLVEAGNARVELERTDADVWNYSLKTEPQGLFKLAGKGYVLEVASFAVVEQNIGPTIQPKSYKFRQDNQQKRAIDATFNWDQMQLYFSRGVDNAQEALNADTLDRMTMTITMMSTLQPDFENYTLNVFDGGRIKQVLLVNEGTENIKTSLGDLETVRVRTSNLASNRRQTITWFAPKLNNLPVRIEQIKDGKLVARLSVRQYEQK